MIQKAHDAGIRCNLFYTDTTEEAEYYYGIGVDAILTNNPLKVMAAAKTFMG
jgi:glycerophosphoryl diester phosphodiesterase